MTEGKHPAMVPWLIDPVCDGLGGDAFLPARLRLCRLIHSLISQGHLVFWPLVAVQVLQWTADPELPLPRKNFDSDPASLRTRIAAFG